jgi:hypothetical protein
MFYFSDYSNSMIHLLLKKLLKSKSLRITLAVLIIAIITIKFFVSIAQAGTFESASMTISDSRASKTNVTYDFALTAQADTAIKQVDIYFCTTPSGDCTAPTDMNTGSPTMATSNISGDPKVITKIGGLANTIRVTVTTPETQDPLAITMQFTGITNPSTENSSIYARVYSFSDTGTTRIDNATVAAGILTGSSIEVSAEIGPTFSFTVTPVTVGTVNSAAINVTDTTANTIPFGVLSSGTAKIAAHDLSVTTNANTGYQITVKALANPPLVDGDNDIDSFQGGTNLIPATWSAPAGGTKNTNTGFFGYTTNDATLTNAGDGVDRFDGNKWAGTTTTAAEIAYSNVAVGGGETTRVGWEAQINAIQPPGSYAGSVILVATPTY